MQIQTTTEMAPYFTMTNLFIKYFTRSTERLPTLPSSISNISMTVVETTLLNMRDQYSVKYNE